MFRVENHGSIVLIHAQDEAARVWVNERVDQIDGYQPMIQSGTIVCDHRCAAGFIEQLQAEGMEVTS